MIPFTWTTALCLVYIPVSVWLYKSIKSIWQLLTVRQYKGSLYGQGSLKNYQDVFSYQIIQKTFHGSITLIILEGHSNTFLKLSVRHIQKVWLQIAFELNWKQVEQTQVYSCIKPDDDLSILGHQSITNNQYVHCTSFMCGLKQ